MDDEKIVEETISKFDDFEKTMNITATRNQRWFICRIVIFCLILVGVCIYPLFPSTQVRGLRLEGNYLLSRDEVFEMTTMNKKTPVIFLNEQKFINELKNSPIIEDASIDWKPSHMILKIDEVAAMLNNNGETYLSNTQTISELRLSYPNCAHDFGEENVPTFLSNLFTKFNNKRQKVFLKYLKDIDRSVLEKATYVDYRGSGETFTITEGYVVFYFANTETNIYNRIAVKENNLGLFLNEQLFPNIITQMNLETNAKVFTDSVNENIKYKSTTCYSGTKVINGITYENACVTSLIN